MRNQLQSHKNDLSSAYYPHAPAIELFHSALQFTLLSSYTVSYRVFLIVNHLKMLHNSFPVVLLLSFAAFLTHIFVSSTVYILLPSLL